MRDESGAPQEIVSVSRDISVRKALELEMMDARDRLNRMRKWKLLYAIDGDLVNRAGPRIVQGAEIVCKDLDNARRKRPAQ